MNMPVNTLVLGKKLTGKGGMNVKLRVSRKKLRDPDVCASSCLEILSEFTINAKSKYMHLC